MIPRRPDRLRVLTLNIRRLRDSRDAVVTVLREAAPDVVALQEVTRGPTGHRRMVRLARAAGLVALRTPGSRTTGLLVAPDLARGAARGVRLPTPWPRTRRGVAVVDLGDARVMSVHLGLSGPERLRQVDRIIRLVRASPVPVVLAGDVNERPGGPTWRQLALHLRDGSRASGPTFPAADAEHRIDVGFTTSEVVVAEARVRRDEVARAASDHLPLLLEVSLRPGAGDP